MEQMDVDEVDFTTGIPESFILRFIQHYPESHQVVEYKIIHFASNSDKTIVLDFLRNIKPSQFPRLFMLIIEPTFDDDSLTQIVQLCQTRFIDRPFLIENAKKVYVKSNATSQFTIVSNKKVKNLIEFKFEVKKPNFKLNFEILYSAMCNNIFDTYEGSVLKQKMSINAKMDGKSLKELALKSNDNYVLRYLELFNTNTYDEKYDEILKVVEYGNVETFLTLTDTSFISDYIPCDNNLNQLLLHENSNGDSILGTVLLKLHPKPKILQ